MKMDVRSTLECGGSTPLWNNAEDKDKGGVEPPHSKVLRTFSCTVASRRLMGICGELKSRGPTKQSLMSLRDTPKHENVHDTGL
jgi:hypothetical protein